MMILKDFKYADPQYIPLVDPSKIPKSSKSIKEEEKVEASPNKPRNSLVTPKPPK